jgi:hypothetical protein
VAAVAVEGRRSVCALLKKLRALRGLGVAAFAEAFLAARRISRQLDEWEIEAERPDGLPFAPMAIDAIEQILVAIA